MSQPIENLSPEKNFSEKIRPQNVSHAKKSPCLASEKSQKEKQVRKKHEAKKKAKRNDRRRKKKVRKGRKSRSSIKSGALRRSAAQKNRFLARIRAKIERAKSYPKIAERRGIQGVVRARFVILKNGRLGRIAFTGPSIFYRSARHAIESAFPIDTGNLPVALPMEISLTLRYRLHR